MSWARRVLRALLQVVRLLLSVVVIATVLILVIVVDRRNRDATPSPRSPVPAIDLIGTYVALGDSYSAGEGLQPFIESTQDVAEGGDRCHRSSSAYPLRLRFGSTSANLLFRACSGAEVPHIFDEVQEHDGTPNNNGYQATAELLQDGVGLITLTIGGNDLDFARILKSCFFEQSCPDEPYAESDTLTHWVREHLDAIQHDLKLLYKRIKSLAPDARILVLGYPALFPQRHPSLLDPRYVDCDALLLGWGASERQAIRQWGRRMNARIEAAAEKAEVEYVDTYTWFTGHEPCGPSGQWLQLVGLDPEKSIRDGSFHPTATGQTMLARIISCHLALKPAGAGSDPLGPAASEAGASLAVSMRDCVNRREELSTGFVRGVLWPAGVAGIGLLVLVGIQFVFNRLDDRWFSSPRVMG